MEILILTLIDLGLFYTFGSTLDLNFIRYKLYSTLYTCQLVSVLATGTKKLAATARVIDYAK